MKRNNECPFCKPDKKCNSKHCPYTTFLKYNVVDLTGQKFNNLTALSYGKVEKWGRNGWLCECECGNTTTVNTRCLMEGKIKSCGCLRLEHIKKVNSRKPEYTAITVYFNRYKSSAKRRNLEFSLSREQFEEITQKNCTYCNLPPSRKEVYKGPKKESIYVSNGIDRVDSNLGYFYENCTSCCSRCNTMKMSDSVGDFVDHVSKIYEHCVTKEEK